MNIKTLNTHDSNYCCRACINCTFIHRHSVLSNTGLGIKNKKCLHEGVIVPTALYGAETWGMRSAERKKVNVREIKCLRIFVGVSRMVGDTERLDLWCVKPSIPGGGMVVAPTEKASLMGSEFDSKQSREQFVTPWSCFPQSRYNSLAFCVCFLILTWWF